MQKIMRVANFILFFYLFFNSILFSQSKSIDNTESYLPLLVNKNIALVVNQNSVIGDVHLVDTLKNLGINIISIFSPEHGFDLNYAAGENVLDSEYNNIPIYSLYGENKKPTLNSLTDVDVVLFDIQDVGVRFYTYISTLHYIMESCAEENIPLIILDRDNLHSNYIDGPVLNKKFSSFVGMHQVPVVYGMTIGEYALMINGENWLPNLLTCDLNIIKLKHRDPFNLNDSVLSHPPSPNLKTNLGIKLYPTLCFFEGSVLSIGRGTDFPFQVIGCPSIKTDFIDKLISEKDKCYNFQNYYFTPISRKESRYPKFQNQKCFGVKFNSLISDCEIVTESNHIIDLSILINFYNNYHNKNKFFNNFFNKLAGNSSLKEKIMLGWTPKEIRDSWQKDLKEFNKIRKKYLLYKR